MCSREGHGDTMPSRLVVGPGRPFEGEGDDALCSLLVVAVATTTISLNYLVIYFLYFGLLPKLWNAIT